MNARAHRLMFGAAFVSASVLLAAALLSPRGFWVGKVEAQEKAPPVQAQNDREEIERDLQGTWRAQITIRDCQTDAPAPFPGNPFSALITFAQGGTLTSVDAYPGLGPAQLGVALGVWRTTTPHSFSGTAESFVFDTAGTWIGTKRLTQSITVLHPNEFTARAESIFFAPNGGPIPGFPPLTICATSIGWRMD